jgi:hypothetical protein
VFLRRRKLQKAGQIPVEFPKIDLNDRMFRHGLDIVLVATIVNLLVVAVATIAARPTWIRRSSAASPAT